MGCDTGVELRLGNSMETQDDVLRCVIRGAHPVGDTPPFNTGDRFIVDDHLFLAFEIKGIAKDSICSNRNDCLIYLLSLSVIPAHVNCCTHAFICENHNADGSFSDSKKWLLHGLYLVATSRNLSSCG